MGRVWVFGCPGEEGEGVCEAVFIVGFSGEPWIPGSGRYILDVFMGLERGFGVVSRSVVTRFTTLCCTLPSTLCR